MIKRKRGTQGKIQLRDSGGTLRFDPLASFEGLQLKDCREIALFQKNKMKAVRWWKYGVQTNFQKPITLTALDWAIPHNKNDKEMFVRVTLKQRERSRTTNGVGTLRSKITIPKQDFWLPYFYPEAIEYGETSIRAQ